MRLLPTTVGVRDPAQEALMFHKPFRLLVLSAAVLTTAVGCAATPATTSVVPTVEQALPCPEATGDYGDAIPLNLVKDDFGVYCHVTVNPDAAAYTMFETVIDTASFAESGVDVAEAKLAFEAAIIWGVEQNIDSSVADSGNLVDLGAWFERVGAPAIDDEFADEYRKLADDRKVHWTGLIISYWGASPLSRDGGPRVSDVSIVPTEIRVVPEDDALFVRVEFDTATKSPASDEAIVAAVKRTSERGDDEIRAKAPELFDGVDDSVQLITNDWQVAYQVGDYTKISGTSQAPKLRTDTGFGIAG
jgi:hypothetical protein